MTARLLLIATLSCLIPLLAPASPALPVEPPTMILRDIAKAPRIAQGTSITLEKGIILFLPTGWTETISTASSGQSSAAFPGTVSPSQIPLTAHFHGAPWFAIEEHARRGAKHPLVAVHLGEGSSVYRRGFENPTSFTLLLNRVRAELASQGAPNLSFQPIELTSFSAGYGAIRELLKQPESIAEVRRVVLADSLYSSLTTESAHATRHTPFVGEGGTTITTPAGPPAEQMAPFVQFARKAAAGEKEMLIAHTTIVTPTYGSTVETADYIVAALGAKREVVTTGSLRAADAGLSFPLTARLDRGSLHIWQYDGNTAQAHMAAARTLADFHRELDKSRK